MFKTIFWRIRNLILVPCVHLGRWDFRLDFYRRNPRGMLASSILIEVQLWLAFRFEQLHYTWRRLLKSQHGATSLEAAIITACFVVIIIVAMLAMCSQGGTNPVEVVATLEAEAVEEVETYIKEDLAEDLEQAQELKEEIAHEVCASLCEVDYDSGLTNVTQYSNCLSYCD